MQNAPEASVQAKAFVYEQLKNHDFPNYEKIVVKVGDNYEAFADSVIILPGVNPGSNKTWLDVFLDECASAANSEHKKIAEDKLVMVKAIISHEISHLRRNDDKRLILAALTTPVITFTLSKIIQHIQAKAWNSNDCAKPESSFSIIGKGLLRGFICSSVNNIITHTHARGIEQRADDEIKNDVLYLKGMKNFLEGAEKYLRDEVLKSYGSGALAIYDTNRFYYELLNFKSDASHPSPKSRLERINARLEALQKK